MFAVFLSVAVYRLAGIDLGRQDLLGVHSADTLGLSICTLISENQGVEKLRSVSNLRKISGPAHLDFFSVCHLDFFQVYGINLAFFSRWTPRKKIQVCRT